MTRALHTAFLGACLALSSQPAARAAITARTAVPIADEVNVRGRPEPRSEVILQLSKGRRVTVLEEVAGPRLDGSQGLWSRIALPSGTPLWVFGDFVDPDSGEVTTRLLNIRSGKGEQHDIVGVLLKGERVEQIRREGNWLEIKAPIGAYGYVASEYLETVKLRVGEPVGATESPAPQAVPAMEGSLPPTGQGQPDAVPAPVPPASTEPAPTALSVTAPETTPATPPSTPASDNLATSSGELSGAPVETDSPPISTPSPVVEEAAPVTAAPAESSEKPVDLPEEPVPVAPLTPAPAIPVVSIDPGSVPATPRRVAIREGIVKRTLSIQAPGEFELRHSATGDRLVYLYPANSKIDLKRFHRRRVRVRGEEFIDPRWPNCAVLFVERISLAP